MTDQLTQQQREALEALDRIACQGLDALCGDFRKVRTYILNSTPTREGWQLVPVELVSVLREVVRLHEEKGVVLTVHMNDVALLLDRADAPTPEDSRHWPEDHGHYIGVPVADDPDRQE